MISITGSASLPCRNTTLTHRYLRVFSAPGDLPGPVRCPVEHRVGLPDVRRGFVECGGGLEGELAARLPVTGIGHRSSGVLLVGAGELVEHLREVPWWSP